MNQRQQTHPAGTFAACACCRREPRHFVASGRTAREPVTFGVIGTRHQLESACGRRTGWRASLADAVRGWGELGETLPLALSPRHASNVQPMRAAQGRVRR
jgi:hypothetical protein